MTGGTVVPYTIAQFVIDFPEFSDALIYPAAALTFYLNIANALLNTQRWGTLLNNGIALYMAHHMVLYRRRQLTVSVGGDPGLQKGNIASETPGAVSLSYDTSVSSEDGAGFYNSTEYGVEFIRLARLMGMGPVMANLPGPAPMWGSGSAWVGPSMGWGFSN